MAIENYEIVGSYNNQRILSIDAERSVNCFEYIDPMGKKQKSLIGSSGIDLSGVDFGGTTGGFRGSFVFNNVQYHVIGTSVWRIDLVGGTPQPTLINGGIPLTSNAGYVGIDANTFQVIFVDGLKGYIYDTTTHLFAQITDPAFPALPLDVSYLDGFFAVIAGNTNNFQICTNNQGLIWGADNTGTLNGIQFNSTSTITLTSGTNANYQVGTPVTVSASSDANIPNGNYFIVGISGTTIIKLATTNGGTALVAAGNTTAKITNNGQLQQGSITSYPGTLVACKTLHRRLFFFSQFFTEVWENQGAGTNLPFRRNNSILIEYGTPAIGSVKVGFDKMFFLSQDRDGLGAVMEVIGAEAVPVSTKALDYQLAQYAKNAGVSDCISFLIRENGLIFYRMNFTASDHTFCYNVTQSEPSQDATKMWHEEETFDGHRHPTQTHVFWQGKNYAGDYQKAYLYLIDPMLYDMAGNTLHRYRIGKAYAPQGYQRIRINRFQVDFLQGQSQDDVLDNQLLLTENGVYNLITESGLNLLTEQTAPINTVVTPRAFFSYSKDGGQTFGTILPGNMGQEGDRTFRTLWRKIGVTKRGQSFVPRIDFYDPVAFVVLGAAWDYEVLPE